MQQLRRTGTDSERHVATLLDQRDSKIQPEIISQIVRDMQQLHGTGATVREGQQPLEAVGDM